MSLINKVLTDLEARSGNPIYNQRPRSYHEDLRPVHHAPKSASRTPLLVLLALILGGAVVYSGLHWQQLLDAPPVDPVAAGPPPTASPPLETALAQPPATLTTSTPIEATVTPPPAPVAMKEAAVADTPPARPRATAKPKKKEKTTGVAAAPAPAPRPAETGAIDKKARPLTAQEQAENAYRAAGAALKRQDRAQAERELKGALALSAKHTAARELYAGLLLEQGRALEAQQLLEQGLAKMPDHYPFAQLLARLYVEHGAEHKALPVLQQARASGQADADFLALSATLAQRAGRHTDAITDFDAALRLRPAEGRWWAGLAISLEADRRWSAARDAYQKARASGRLNATLVRHVDERLAALKDRRD